MFHKKTISSNYNQNTNEKLTKIGKKYQNRIAYVQFYETKLHRGRKKALSIGIIKEKLPYKLIFDKKTVKRSKNEEINIKNVKN